MAASLDVIHEAGTNQTIVDAQHDNLMDLCTLGIDSTAYPPYGLSAIVATNLTWVESTSEGGGFSGEVLFNVSMPSKAAIRAAAHAIDKEVRIMCIRGQNDGTKLLDKDKKKC